MSKKIEYCCDSMKTCSILNCDLLISKYDCPDVLIDSEENGSVYRIIIHDGGSSGIEINFCHWCGKKLR
jgi:hypothetical protein